MFVYHDCDQVADMLRVGQTPRPSVSDMLNPNTVVGATLARILLSAAGRIEGRCLVGKRYQPDDLRALVDAGGSAAEILIKLNADLAFWMLCQRRQPNASDPKNVPGAAEAYEYLKALGEGEAIFGFRESAEAGLPTANPPDAPKLITPNAVARAYRLFPTYQLGQQNYGGGGGS